MLEPLASKFSMLVESGYGTAQKVHLASSIFESLRSGDGCGGVVVIAWKHENLPKLSAALGCSVDEGCPFEYEAWDYDKVWEIRYTYDEPMYSSKKSGKVGGADWIIQGSVVEEGFDALAWEKEGHGSF